MLLSRVAFGERLTARKAGALAVVGTVLTVGLSAVSTALGVALGVTAAVIYNVYIVGSAVVTPEAGALASATVVISSAAVVHAGLALATRPDHPTGAVGLLADVGLVLVSTVVAIGTFFAGLRLVGATAAATLSSPEPAVTVALAVTLLGETVAPLQFAGGGLVLAAVLLLARAGAATAPVDNPAAGPVAG